MDKNAIIKELEKCTWEAQLKEFFVTYLGKKWSINEQFKLMKDLSNEEKKTKWKEVKELFDAVQSAFETRQSDIKKAQRDKQLWAEIVDRSTPANTLSSGHANLQNKLRKHIETIFQWMGFHIEYGHDVVTTEENFESVNIPSDHPATEMHDTLYLQQQSSDWQKLLLRTHTSAHQAQLIQKYWPACKFVVPGKVYRNENMDATHDTVFRQIEGVVIDEGITLGHFKYMMQQILEAILETDGVELRMRPAYFPFVEPGVEIDAKVEIWWKVKWLEILWAGMIHPNVLENAWVDTKKYSWFAFGLGMTRLVAVKYWLWDIRLLTNGDLRFAKSFT